MSDNDEHRSAPKHPDPAGHSPDNDGMIEGEEPPPRGVKVMAVVRWVILAIAALLAIVMWWSYARGQFGGSSTATTQQTARYHCPMHPQIVSDERGECPICHMSLEPISANRAANAPPPASARGASSAATPAGSASSDSGAASYTCPMHPEVRSDHPGSCPICKMDLQPMQQGAGKEPDPASNRPARVDGDSMKGMDMRSDRGAANAMNMGTSVPGVARSEVPPGSTPPGTSPITLTLDRVQAIGVRTAVVGEGTASQMLRVTALVAPTEQGVAEVHVRTPGFVERILVNQTGITVGRQQSLFYFYSPEIFQAQSELLAANQWTGQESSSRTVDSSRRKLELLGMSASDIDKVMKTRGAMRAIPIYAPQPGYVTKKNLVQGSYVTPEMVLYEIQDLSRVYVVADVFQQDIGFLKKGTVGRFIPAQHADQSIEARVDLIYPTLNAEARTTRVRMQVQNLNGTTFRPGQFGTVEFATPARHALTVPRDAVVDTGLYTYVFVVEREGKFSPREIVLGADQGELATIQAGVSAGERVVSGATFLIDSESRLQASAMQMAETAPSGPSQPTKEEGPSCQGEFDRNKYPDKWTECQKCTQIHHGMGSMEADCKKAIPKPWK